MPSDSPYYGTWLDRDSDGADSGGESEECGGEKPAEHNDYPSSTPAPVQQTGLRPRRLTDDQAGHHGTVSLLPALLPTPDVHITDAGVEAALTAAVRIINPLLDVLWQTDP
ncbi:hypothetical protein C6A85_77465, partial [Mycobacterium sp. ITM-2017-0098]